MPDIDQSFQAFYDSELRTTVEQLKASHAKKTTVIWILALWLFPAAVTAVLTWFLLNRNPETAEDAFFYTGLASVPFIVLLTVMLAKIISRDKEARTLFKTVLAPRVLHFISPDLNYFPDGAISSDLYSRSALFPQSYDLYSGEDLVEGEYHGVRLTFSELHTEEKHETTDSKGHTQTSYTDIFKGVFFAAEFNKDFHFRTQVVPDVAESVFGQLIGNFLQKLNIGRPGKLIRMENPLFEKEFAVYGEDDIEARYLLTPNLMERMIELKKYFQCAIAFSFVDSVLFVAISSHRNFFELQGRVSKMNADSLRRLLDEFILFIGIIEELNLTLRIWSKE